MEQKRAMLYPEFDTTDARHAQQRNTASAAIGLPLPVESPPSYDVAISTGVRESLGWTSANAPAPEVSGLHFQPALPVIMEQPTVAMPTRPQPQPPMQSQLAQQQQLQQQQLGLPTEFPTTAVAASNLGPNPCSVLCPVCGTQKTTRMTFTPNSRTHLCALMLCLVGWCCCACCVPYCMNSCRTGNHYCAKCNTFLGAYNTRGFIK